MTTRKKAEDRLIAGANGQTTPLQDVLRAFAAHRASVVALVVLAAIAIAAVIAGFLFTEDQLTTMSGANRLMGPSPEHWFGTDAYGRDEFVRVVYGARYSLFFGITTALVSLVLGTAIGATCAYFGGWYDTIMMRVMDSLVCIPSILLMLTLVAVIGRGMQGIIIALVVTSVPGTARVIRSIVLGVVHNDYIEAARAAGVTDARIIVRHVLPNAIGPILVDVLMSISSCIVAASSMSFLGMGIQPPTPEWGAMINDAISLFRTAPHLVLFPGVAVVVTALCFNLLGDGLTDALDAHSR